MHFEMAAAVSRAKFAPDRAQTSGRAPDLAVQCTACIPLLHLSLQFFRSAEGNYDWILKLSIGSSISAASFTVTPLITLVPDEDAIHYLK